MPPLALDDIMDRTGWSRSTALRKRNSDPDFPAPIDPTAKPLRFRTYEIEAYFDKLMEREPSEVESALMDHEDWDDIYADALEVARARVREELGDEMHDSAEELAHDIFEQDKSELIRDAVSKAPLDGDDAAILGQAFFQAKMRAEEQLAPEWEATVERMAQREARFDALAIMRQHIREEGDKSTLT